MVKAILKGNGKVVNETQKRMGTMMPTRGTPASKGRIVHKWSSRTSGCFCMNGESWPGRHKDSLECHRKWACQIKSCAKLRRLASCFWLRAYVYWCESTSSMSGIKWPGRTSNWWSAIRPLIRRNDDVSSDCGFPLLPYYGMSSTCNLPKTWKMFCCFFLKWFSKDHRLEACEKQWLKFCHFTRQLEEMHFKSSAFVLCCCRGYIEYG